MQTPENLLYSKSHEWILVEDDIATIGITAYAQRELGDVVYVDIQAKGKNLAAGDSFGVIEAIKTVSDLYMPISGKVEEVNTQLEEHPELVNADPYGDGWMIKLQISQPEEIKELLHAKDYKVLTTS